MTSILELRNKASMLGIGQTDELDRIALVRSIQRHMGEMACYCGELCDSRIRNRCYWRYECTASTMIQKKVVHSGVHG